MGIGEDDIGLIISLGALTYAITSPIIGHFKNIPRLYVTLFAFINSVVGLILFGPSPILGLPNHYGLIIAGIGLMGISASLIVVPLLPELIDAVKEKEHIPESQLLNDKASAVYNTSQAVGSIIGPILGGFLQELVGFRSTCDIMALGAAAFTVVYFAFNVVPYMLKSKQEKTCVDIEAQHHIIKEFDND